MAVAGLDEFICVTLAEFGDQGADRLLAHDDATIGQKIPNSPVNLTIPPKKLRRAAEAKGNLDRQAWK